MEINWIAVGWIIDMDWSVWLIIAVLGLDFNCKMDKEKRSLEN